MITSCVEERWDVKCTCCIAGVHMYIYLVTGLFGTSASNYGAIVCYIQIRTAFITSYNVQWTVAEEATESWGGHLAKT